MNSPKSYAKFQKLYEVVLPIIGLSSLFAWDGDIKIKIPIAIILYRSCVIWSELAVLERRIQGRELKDRSLNNEGGLPEANVYETEGSSWASMIGLLLQILITVAISALIAHFI